MDISQWIGFAILTAALGFEFYSKWHKSDEVDELPKAQRGDPVTALLREVQERGRQRRISPIEEEEFEELPPLKINPITKKHFQKTIPSPLIPDKTALRQAILLSEVIMRPRAWRQQRSIADER